MELQLETKEDSCSSCFVYMWQVKQIFHFSRKIKTRGYFSSWKTETEG